jgi:small subunit ribosomal protein S18
MTRAPSSRVLFSANPINPRRTGMTHEAAMAELGTHQARVLLQQQAPRRYKEGDVYAPHDLSVGEAKKWKRIQRRPEKDVFDMLGRNPIEFYKVCCLTLS